MAVLTDKGVIMLTPRCGSTYVLEFLRFHGINHLNLTNHKFSRHTPFHLIKKCFSSEQKYYTLFRKPDEWYRSVWGIQKGTNYRKWELGKWHPFREIENIKGDKLQDWLNIVNSTCPNFYERTMELYGNSEEKVMKIELPNLTKTLVDIFSKPPLKETRINRTNYEQVE